MNTNSFLTIVRSPNLAINDVVTRGREDVFCQLPYYVNTPGVLDLHPSDDDPNKSDWSIFGFSSMIDTGSTPTDTVNYLKHVYSYYAGGLIIVDDSPEVRAYLQENKVRHFVFNTVESQAVVRKRVTEYRFGTDIIFNSGDAAEASPPDVLFALTRLRPEIINEDDMLSVWVISSVDVIAVTKSIARGHVISFGGFSDYDLSDAYKVPQIDVKNGPSEWYHLNTPLFYEESKKTYMARRAFRMHSVRLSDSLLKQPQDTVVYKKDEVLQCAANEEYVYVITKDVSLGLITSMLGSVNASIDEEPDPSLRLLRELEKLEYAKEVRPKSPLGDDGCVYALG